MKRILLAILSSAIPYVIYGCHTKAQSNQDIPQVDIARLEEEAEEEAQAVDKIRQDDSNLENYVFWSTQAYLRTSPETVTPTLATPPQTIKSLKQPKTSDCKKRITRIAYCCEFGCFLASAATLFAGAIIGCFNVSETSQNFSTNTFD